MSNELVAVNDGNNAEGKEELYTQEEMAKRLNVSQETVSVMIKHHNLLPCGKKKNEGSRAGIERLFVKGFDFIRRRRT